MFTDKDLQQVQSLGMEIKEIERQVEMFRQGIDFVELVKPAVPGDGIEDLTETEIDELIHRYEEKKNNYSIIRFIPASGAASRMFKSLFEAMEMAREKGNNALKSRKEIMDFFAQIKEYPFYSDLEVAALESGLVLNNLLRSENFDKILELTLSSKGLNYGFLPKGLLKFHSYSEGSRTAIEEHYEEAMLYLADGARQVNLHFTVSPEHHSLFKGLCELLNAKHLENNNYSFKVEFSIQKPSTDTIAVDKENNPFRLENGKILFRPGGHGSLIDNLNDLKESIVFIGNIDNISPSRNIAFRVKYKKFLGGFLISKMEQIHSILRRVDSGENSQELKKEILDAIYSISPITARDLGLENNSTVFYEKSKAFLNRPMRVCGMVKNIGEPGGGPFWVKNKKGTISKQIIESSQINLDDEKQEKLFREATHFNPVDMVCCRTDYNGSPFRLHDFVDHDMAFISHKSQGGKELKALERPGLWNGSMAGWLTWFVDVPLETFSPVKTVFDLNRPEHRS